jgi:hypothetical protein
MSWRKDMNKGGTKDDQGEGREKKQEKSSKLKKKKKGEERAERERECEDLHKGSGRFNDAC